MHSGELQGSPVFRHCKEAIEPFLVATLLTSPTTPRGLSWLGRMVFQEALVGSRSRPEGRDWSGLVSAVPTNSRCELYKHRFAIQVICIAGFYRLKDLVAPPEEPTQSRLSKRERRFSVEFPKACRLKRWEHAPYSQTEPLIGTSSKR